jgi:hypothetical protein
MKYLKSFNDDEVRINESKTLNSKFIEDIDDLISNLQYLKSFIKKNIEDDDLKFFTKTNLIHTDIQLLSGKIKRP